METKSPWCDFLVVSGGCRYLPTARCYPNRNWPDYWLQHDDGPEAKRPAELTHIHSGNTQCTVRLWDTTAWRYTQFKFNRQSLISWMLMMSFSATSWVKISLSGWVGYLNRRHNLSVAGKVRVERIKLSLRAQEKLQGLPTSILNRQLLRYVW